MIVHTGGKASGFKNVSAKDSFSTNGTALFRVRGTNALNTVATEVTPTAGSLNSDDVFILVTPEIVTVWAGRGANALEKDTGANIASILANGYELSLCIL